MGVVKMNLGFVTIKVNDMKESLKFYSEFLGFEKAMEFSPQKGVNIVFLKDKLNNKVELIEYEFNKNSEIVKDCPASLGFNVDSLEEILKVIKEKDIKIIHGPVETPAGQKFVYISDPNGVGIEFIEGFNL